MGAEGRVHFPVHGATIPETIQAVIEVTSLRVFSAKRFRNFSDDVRRGAQSSGSESTNGTAEACHIAELNDEAEFLRPIPHPNESLVTWSVSSWHEADLSRTSAVAR